MPGSKKLFDNIAKLEKYIKQPIIHSIIKNMYNPEQ